ncbi:YadA-like family protein [Bartonella schoenbuchensis]|uniref:YadA-like family protein n=1 Tax=Bartonella schoenbuchensis TaxID=165694 RepID=UPI00314524CF
MKKVHIAPKNKSFNAQRLLSEVSLVRAVSLGAVMAGLLSSVSPVFASHLSSTGLTVQSVSAGVISANVAHGRVGVVNGGHSCGVDQVVSRGLSLGNKEQYKKLTANRLSDGSGGYSFESSCRADASVNALPSTSARSLIDVAAEDWFLEENNTINGSVNTRSVNTTGTHVVKMQTRGVVDEILCKPGEKTLCVGEGEKKENYNVASTDLSDKSTEAVNSPQPRMQKEIDKLKSSIAAVKEDITKLNDGVNLSLGGGANVLEGKAPTYEIQQQSYTGVADAFAGVDSKLTELSGKIEGVGDIKVDRFVERDKQSNRFTIGKNIKGSEISIVNQGGKVRVLTGLADGSVTEGSTDAVTGNQLYKTSQNVEKLTGTVKGVQDNITKIDTIINATLAFGANVLQGNLPTYTIQQQSYTGVEAAFKGVDENLTNISDKVKLIEGHSFVEQDEESKVITIGKKIEGDEVIISGIKGASRILSGLKDGAVTEGSKDAITGAQLYKLGSNVSEYLGGSVDILKGAAPKYEIQDKNHTSVADAFKGIDNTLTTLSDRIGNVTGIISNSLIEQDESHKITIGGKVEGGEISIAGSKGVRKLTDLEKGELAESSTDAVTGAQLHDVKQNAEKLTETVSSVQQNITKFNENITKSLGGGADVLKGQQPTYKIQDQGRTGVADAFAGVNDTLTVLSGKIGDVEKNSLVKQDKSGLITIGANVEGSEISIANNTGGVRKLTGLADGSVTEGSTDAVTGNQLYKTSQNVEKLTGTVKGVQDNITKIDTNINASLAGEANVLQGKAPTYTIQHQERTGIASAFAGVDEKLTSLLSDVKKVTSTIGSNLVLQQDSKITIGAKVVGDKISIIGSEGLRKLTNLEEGTVSDVSTDAVTGKQLHGVKQSAEKLTKTVSGVQHNLTEFNENVTKSLGGKADILSGKVPTYSIQDKERTGVADAFAGVDEKLTWLSKQINSAEDGTLIYNDFVSQEKDTNIITIGKDVDGDKISILNNEGKVRVLSGVAEATVSAQSTDAVSGKQLYETLQTVEKLNSSAKSVQGDISKFDKNLSAYLGGGADILKGTAPTYIIQKYGYIDIGTAFEGVSSSLKDLSAKAVSAQESVQARLEDEKLVEQDEFHVITIGKDVDGDKISILNNEGKVRVLSGVAEATVSAQSTDAVSGKQLYKLDQSIEKLSSSTKDVQGDISKFDKNLNAYLGGGADVLKGTAPTYSIQGKGHDNIASAFEGVGEKLTDLSAKVGEATSSFETRMESEKLVTQDPVSNLIMIGAETDGTEINITNSEGTVRVLSGVAEGDVSKGSKDAVSGKQLYELAQSIEKLNSGAENAQTNIATFNKNLNIYLSGADVLNGTAPKYTIQDKEHDNIASAFAGVDEKLTSLLSDVKKVTSTIGSNLVLQQDSKITIGAKVVGDKISIIGSEGLRKLTNLEEGTVSDVSTDAVTGKQLHGVKQSAEKLTKTVSGVQHNLTEFNENVTKSLGGKADILSGKVPTYSIQDKERTGVADAFAGVDEKLTWLSKQINSAEDGTLIYNDFVSQEKDTNIITIGKDVDGDKISILNNEGKVRVLSGVAEATVSAQSTDAVSGKQLYETLQTVEKLNSSAKSVQGDISKFDKNLSAYLGGGADILKGTAPTYIIQKYGYIDIGTAFEGVSSSLKDLSAKAVSAQESVQARLEDEKLVEQDEFHVITIGKDVDGDKISILNNEGKVRVLSGVAEATVSAQSTDAVSGKQLYKLDQSIEKLSSSTKDVQGDISKFDKNLNAYLGGGADVLKGTAPTYSIQGKGHDNIASAFEGVGEKLTDLSAKVGEATSSFETRMESEKLVTQDPVSNLIMIGAETDGTEINITNSEGTVRVLSGVAEGDVSKGSKDAVSGKQLYELAQSIEKLNSGAENAQTNIATFNKNLNIYLSGADVLNGTAPKYTIQDKEHDNIASAFAGVDEKLTSLLSDVKKVTSTIGSNLVLQQDSKITIGAKVVGDKISIIGSEGLRKLTNLEEGTVSDVSTDAVTGKQLHGVKQSAEKLTKTVSGVQHNLTEFNENVTKSLGGKADILSGKVPTYSIQDKERTGVADAFAGVDEKLTWLSKQINSAEDGTLIYNDFVSQEKDTNIITIGKDVDGDKISILNNEGKVRVLSGVAEATVSAQSTDAVSGKQLYETLQTVEKLNSSAKSVQGDISKFDKNLSAYLGGGADILKGTAPTYIIQKYGYIDIGTAFEGVSSSLKDLSAKAVSAQESVQARLEDEKLVEQDEFHVITIGKDVDGDKISILNNEGKVRVLSGVAEATVSAQSTDAVSGKQLYKLDQSIEKLSSSTKDVQGDISKFDKNLNAYLGGGADVLKGTAPTYSIQGKGHDNIASAFEGVGEKLTDLSAKVGEATSSFETRMESEKLVTQDPVSNLIMIGAETDGTEINITNSEGTVRVLSGVAEGDVSKGSKDAVSGKQLYELAQSIEKLNSGAENAQTNIATFNKNLNIYLSGADVLNGTAPKYTIQDKEHDNIASAFAGVDEKLTSLLSDVKKVTSTIGSNLVLQQDSKITIGAKVVGDKISIIGSEGLRKLTNLEEGTVSDVSTDAVTGKQLHGVKQSAEKLTKTVSGVQHNLTEFNENVTKSLGGKADILSGKVPTYSIQDKERTGVADAFAGVDEKLTWLSKQINSAEDGTLIYNDFVSQEKDTNIITIGKDVDGDKISILNNEGKVRVLSGVAEATVSAQSTDAVSGKQLYETLQTVEKLNSSAKSVQGDISKFDKNLSAYLGGGADILKGTAPTYIIQKYGYIDIGTTFEGVSSSLKDLSAKAVSAQESVQARLEDEKLVEQDEFHVITIGKDVDGDKISILNNEGKVRVLSGVAEATVSAQSTDAVSGKQLYKLDQSIEKLSSSTKDVQGDISKFDKNLNAYLGGGADVLKGTAPTYSIQGKGHDNIASAFEGVGEKLTDLSAKVGEATSSFETRMESEKLVTQDPVSNLIMIGAETDGTEINITNSEGTVRVLSGVAEGDVSKGSKDAVSGKQLYELAQSIEKLNSGAENAQTNIATFNKNLNIYLSGADVLNGTAPKYTIQDKEHDNIASAFAGVDEKLTSLLSDVKKVTSTIGSNLVLQQDSKITIGAKVVGDKISIIGSEGLRKLTNLEEGTVSDVSTDAVTGKQLHGVKQSAEKLTKTVSGVQHNLTEFNENVTKSLGGKADILSGKVPTYSIQDKERTGVADAFAGVDEKLTWLSKQINSAEDGTLIYNDFVSQEKDTNIITIGKDVDGDKISILNNEGKVRVLSGVAEATVSAQSTDAVSGKQLYETLQTVEKLNSSAKSVQGDISKFDKNLSAYLGGGADILKGTAPTYIIQKYGYIDIGTTFEGVSSSLKDLSAKAVSAQESVQARLEDEKLVEQDEFHVITIGKDVDGDKISILNNEGKVRVLSGVAEATVSAQSTDAVSGKQLYKLDQSIEKLSSSTKDVQGDISKFDKNLNAYLGGGADVLKGTAPTYSIQGKGHDNIASAFEGVGEKLTDLSAKVGEATSSFETRMESEKLVTQDPVSNLIMIGAETDGTEINITNSEGTVRVLSGVAEGDVSKGSKDAVSGKQLYELAQSIEKLNSGAENAQTNIATFNKNLNIYLSGADVLNGTAPKYTIQDKEHDNIASAFAGVDEKLTWLSKQINSAEDGTLIYNDFVSQEKDTNIITIGKDVDGDKISILNNEGKVRVLSGVAEATVSAQSTDAVSGKQLYETLQTVEKLNSSAKSVQGDISKFDKNLSAYLGGGADILKGTAPTYIIQKYGYIDIGTAFEGVSSSLKDLSAKAVSAQESVQARLEDEKLVEQDEFHVITIGKDVDGDKISILNNEGKVRVLSGVAEATVSAQSTDAVSGKQLYKLDQSIEKLSSSTKDVQGDISKFDKNLNAYLGGGADVLKGTAPTYSIQGKGHDNIASAFEGVGEKLTDLSAKVGEATSSFETRMESEKLVTQDPVSNLIMIGAETDGTEINITNSEGTVRVLSGVAEGDVSKGSKDAVSGKQLYELAQSIEKLNSGAENAQTNIATFNKNLNIYLSGADVLNGTAPKYTIQDKEHDNIASAFAGVDEKLTWLSKQINSAEDGTLIYNDFVSQEKDTNIITIGKDVDGDKISILNNEGKVRVLSGVAEATVSAQSTDAVSGKQLYETLQTVEKLNSSAKSVQGDISKFDKNLSAYLGGGADILKGTAPTYIIQKYGYIDIGTAFEGVSSSLKDLSAKAVSAQESVQARLEDEKLVEQDEFHVITIGKDVDGDKISILNNEGKVRVLSGVAEATVSAQSTDAVSGKQLYKLDQSIEKLSSSTKDVQGDISKFDKNLNAYLGGGADVLKGTAPTYSIQGKGHDNIASAFEGVGEKLTDLSAKVGEATSSFETRMESEKLVTQDPVSNLIMIGAETDGTEINITNSEGTVRVLSGVAEGDVSAQSTDAVSGKQLYELAQSIEKLNSGAENAQTNIATFNKNLNTYLGGDADVLKGTAPKYTIQDKEHDNIASAFEGIDTSLTGLANKIDDIANSAAGNGVVDNGFVEQNPDTGLITVSAETEGTEINIANNEKAPRTLSGVADGDISEHSTQAVNGAQLYEINTTIAQYFGGSADYNGQWKEPIFMIKNFGAQGQNGEQTYNNVAEAFGAVNTSISGLNDRVQQVENQYSNSVNWGADKDAYSASHNGQVGKITNVANGDISKDSTDMVTGDQLWETNEKFGKVENKVDTFMGGIVTYDKDTDGNKINSITLVGTDDDTPVLIDNVADGKVEEGSKQAVNGGQLYDYTKEQMDIILADANKYTDEKIQNIKNIPTNITTQANAYTDMKFNTLNSEIEKAQKEARQAAAIGLAVSNLRYNNTAGKFSVAFGSGIWHGQSAFAFGAGYTSEDGSIRSNLSATTAGGHWGIGAGLSLMLK